MSSPLTIGILAHVDAGKTSITECILHRSGATKVLGSVDKGSAITDGLAMEKERGISIRSSAVSFRWENRSYQLVDTPGHLDFAAEVDRSLSILDAVILVVSAKEGVQAHTLNLWESLLERELPVLVFINKIDRPGVDLEQVFLSFQKDLGAKLFSLNHADLSTPNQPRVFPVERAGIDRSSLIFETSLENLAELDESFLADYLADVSLNPNTADGKVNMGQVLAKAENYVRRGTLCPILFGSAKLDLGLDDLLDTIGRLFDVPSIPFERQAAKVFKVSIDEKKGRLAHIRSYGGALKSKDVIYSQGLDRDLKINQLFKPHLGGLAQVEKLLPGEIGLAATSMQVVAGDVLGKEQLSDSFTSIGEAILGVEVVASSDKDYQKLGEALEILNLEDPTLDFNWFKEEREFHLKILGPIQTEVLKESLVKRWGIEAEFRKPKVIYKETPSSSAEGFVRYWMPKPCWAIMTFLIEPAPKGSGVTFTNKVRTSDISSKYINEVKRAIPWSLTQGIKGYEVTDLKITLLEGSEHTVHSNPGDFLLATPMGVMRGLDKAGTDLLEPMYAFEIKAKQDLLGPISSDLSQMKAQLNAPVFEDEDFSLTGSVSVAQAMDYSIRFNSVTSGKGRLKLTLAGYEKTETTEDKIRSYKGVSPLDEAQWILHRRGAFKADER